MGDIWHSCIHLPNTFITLATHALKMGQYEHSTSCLEKVTLLQYELIIIFTRKILELEQEAQGEQRSNTSWVNS